MTLDEIVNQQKDALREFLAFRDVDESVAESAVNYIRWAAFDAYHQGKRDYVNEDLPKVLHREPGDF